MIHKESVEFGSSLTNVSNSVSVRNNHFFLIFHNNPNTNNVISQSKPESEKSDVLTE